MVQRPTSPLDAILTRRTVHHYDPDRAVDPQVLQHALQAARLAPNHKLTNPWRFAHPGPQTRQRITDIGLALKCDDDTPAPRRERVRRKLADPPELLVVSQPRAGDAFRAREDYAAVACAIQNLMLALWAQGVGSKWSTGDLTRHPDTYRALDIDPEREDIVAFVWIGHPRPEDEPLPTPPRQPLDQVYRALP